MRPALLRLLSLVPFLGMLGGVPFVNGLTPLVFGMPPVLAWVVAWVLLGALTMGIVYACDPANREPVTPPSPREPGER